MIISGLLNLERESTSTVLRNFLKIIGDLRSSRFMSYGMMKNG